MGGRRSLKTSLVMSVFLLAAACGSALGEVIYVDADASTGGDGASWGTAYKYLQDALHKPPASGDQIWVVAGTHYPDDDEGGNVDPNDRTETFQLINGVGIYGGFAGDETSLDERDWQNNETILSGDIGTEGVDTDNSYHVVTGSGTDANAVLDGFTITGGNANGGGDNHNGGGMYSYQGSPTVTNCTFSGNAATHNGGGMYNINSSSPTVVNCTFSGNSADAYGGGMYNGGSNLTVTNCTFSGNKADVGGGMYNEHSSSPTVTNCTFSGNEAGLGGGIHNYWYSNPTVTNCTFSGNDASSDGGGMANEYSDPILTNCTFSGNLAGYDGGGMCNLSSDPNLTNCTFNGNSAGDKGGGMYNSSDSSPSVTNCTFISNSAGADGGGMYNYGSSSPTLTNCTFSSNVADNGGGMQNMSSSPTLTNCTFSDNTAAGHGGGMYNSDSRPTVTNCTFTVNVALKGGGMYNYDGSSPTLSNCILWRNTAPTGSQIHNFAGTSANVSYSDIQGGYSGTGNIDVDPLFVDADGPDNIYGTEDDDLRLSAGSLCIDAADNTAVPADSADLDEDGDTTERTPLDLNGKHRFLNDVSTTDTGVSDLPDYPEIVDMGAYEYQCIIFVDTMAPGADDGTTWKDAYKYLQDGLADAAVSGKETRVAQGTYRPDENNANPSGTGNRMATFFLINGVAIYDGFPSGGGTSAERDPNAYETILSGDIGTEGVDTDNSYHVVTGSGTEPNAILNGFTITAGNANGTDPDNSGAGMYNSGGSPTVTNCTFSGNSAGGNGGGMYNHNSSPMLTNCVFIDNSVNHTSGQGGGLYNNLYDSNPVVTNCAFIRNVAGCYGGGMYNHQGTPTLTNCMFSGNVITQQPLVGAGGGMYNNSGDSIIVNCTFSGNQANDEGAGIYIDEGNPSLTNCIFWGNDISGRTDEPAQLYVDNGSADINYSCVQGWTGGLGGAGNIGGDPLFKDADGDDDVVGTEDDNLQLSSDSPCIDAGDNTAVPSDTADLDEDGNTSERTPLDLGGNGRFTDDPVVVDTGNPATGYPEIVDMGAYERYEFCGSSAYPYPPGDVSGPDGIRDCYVDFYDFVVFAAHWLEYTGPE